MKLQKRERWLVALMVIAVGILAFDQFYYMPQKRKLKMWKEEIRAADLKLKESSVLMKGVETIEADLSQMEKRLGAQGGRTVKGGELKAFLKHLAGESARLHMKVISIAPQDAGKAPPAVKKEAPPVPYERVPVVLILQSGFYSVGDYLKGLEDLPFHVDVSRLRVEREEETFPSLKVTITLNIYVRPT
jgi:Tfp pilus assembly protein PilO